MPDRKTSNIYILNRH